MTVMLRPREGAARLLSIDLWMAPATAGEEELLAGLEGPVLDLGCGPGRLVVALGQRGIPALGVDASPAAVGHAIDSGASVLCRSLFDPIPAEGRWRSVLLFDGNIGIGGDPVALLDRVRALLGPGGSAYVEVEPPGSPTLVTEAQVDVHGRLGPWFPWAWVAVDRVRGFAQEAGLELVDWLRPDGRWIARLQPMAAIA